MDMDGTVDRRLKGVIYLGYAGFIKRKGGLEALRKCSGDIGFDLTKIVEEKWYPDTFSLMTIQWVGRTYGPEGLRQMGISTVAQRGVISIGARLVGVRKVLESAQKELSDTINFGKVTCDFTESGASMVLRDLIADPMECEVWTGVFEGLMKISGSKGSVKKVSCQAKGDDACRYEMVWK
jgi:predicted hydrocarbon binding protein